MKTKNVIKVMIKKSGKPSFWYADKIGQIFEVVKYNKGSNPNKFKHFAVKSTIKYTTNFNDMKPVFPYFPYKEVYDSNGGQFKGCILTIDVDDCEVLIPGIYSYRFFKRMIRLEEI